MVERQPPNEGLLKVADSNSACFCRKGKGCSSEKKRFFDLVVTSPQLRRMPMELHPKHDRGSQVRLRGSPTKLMGL